MDDQVQESNIVESNIDSLKTEKSGKFKLIGITIILTAISVIAVYGYILPTFLDLNPEYNNNNSKIVESKPVEYGFELKLEPIVISMLDDRPKVRHLMVNVTFELPNKNTNEITKRSGLVTDIIEKTIRSYKFANILTNEIEDEISLKITTKINSYLPDKDNYIMNTYLHISGQ